MLTNPKFADRLACQIAALVSRGAISVRFQFTAPGGVWYVRRTIKSSTPDGIMAEAVKAARIAGKRAGGAAVLCGAE